MEKDPFRWVFFYQGRFFERLFSHFLTRKWAAELEYRLTKELWAFTGNRNDAAGQWFRAYGNENWEFDESGLMRLRIASINDFAINKAERKFHWPQGRRPDDHPSLSQMGL